MAEKKLSSLSMSNKGYPAWARSVDQCMHEFGVNIACGLCDVDVEKRREKYGWNELDKEKRKPVWKLVLEQFDDTLVKILLAAAMVSFILATFEGATHAAADGLEENFSARFSAYVEPLVILSILILNALVGVWQESNAESALQALKELQPDAARVVRDDRLISDLPARELVPGDIVDLRVGDKIPADIRIAKLTTSTLRVEQSSLTGESTVVLKTCAPSSFDDIEIQGKECMLFSGTTVVHGGCLGIVTGIGLPSVETLGCTTVICSDKTGTLTTNQMSVTVFVANGHRPGVLRQFELEGTTYNPKNGGIFGWSEGKMDPNLQSIAEICALCNDAEIECRAGQFWATGMPTEAALKVLVEKMGIPDHERVDRLEQEQGAFSKRHGNGKAEFVCCNWWAQRSTRLALLEFDRVRKSMSVII